MTIAENIHTLKNQLSAEVRLVAVSKTKPVSDLMEAYRAGQRLFGENKAMEMVSKQAVMPADVEWHFIGHLQTNKVRAIAPFVACIHSVDSGKLLTEINKEAAKNNRIIPCLLQFYIAQEETKFGLSPEEAFDILKSDTFKAFRNIRITGVMGMATFTENMEQVRLEFRSLREIFDHLKAAFFQDQAAFREISMGMSDDYQIAVEEGSTMVRIGSVIFGIRNQI
jgi:pyridoxal phosphate enzyme (YggS family)